MSDLFPKYDNELRDIFRHPIPVIRERTLCRLEWHSRKGRQVHKFNGGSTCWLCGYCCLIVRYDQREGRE